MTDDDRIERARELAKLLKSSPNSRDWRRIEIVDAISTPQLSERKALVNLKKSFRCLACGTLTIHAKCPRPGCRYRLFEPWQTCGFRFFCDMCAIWYKDRQMKAWLRLGLEILRTTGLNLSSGARFEWMLQDVSDARNIVRFGQYVRHTLQKGLEVPWMLLAAIDPLRGSIRGLYLGDSRVVSRGTGDSRVVSVGSKVYGNKSAIWVPRVWPFVAPRPGSPSAESELLTHLQWTVNAANERSCVLPTDVPVAHLRRIYKAYRGRRLYAVHGLAYGFQDHRATEKVELASFYTQDGAPPEPQYCPMHDVRLTQTWEFHLPSYPSHERRLLREM